jgi:hypothetical protein
VSQVSDQLWMSLCQVYWGLDSLDHFDSYREAFMYFTKAFGAKSSDVSTFRRVALWWRKLKLL